MEYVAITAGIRLPLHCHPLCLYHEPVLPPGRNSQNISVPSAQAARTGLYGNFGCCPVLEYLLINGCSVHCLRINSPSLKSIAVSSGEVIIEDTTLLQRLFQLQTGLNISVISAPKLETLGCLDYDSKLVFGTTVIQKLCAVSFTAVVCSVRILAIYMYDLNLDMVINLLRCFSCLEKLYIEPSGRKGTNYFSITNPDIIRCKNLWRRKLCGLIRCLDIRLKKIVLKNYRGIKSEVNFASFFVLNAKMLELMRFEIGKYDDNEKFIAEQHRSLHLKKRASRHAQFYFTTGCEKCRHNLSHFTHINRVSDLSIIDPF